MCVVTGSGWDPIPNRTVVGYELYRPGAYVYIRSMLCCARGEEVEVELEGGSPTALWRNPLASQDLNDSVMT